MHYYVAEWVQQTDDDGPVFRPPLDPAGGWSVIDLRPDPGVAAGYCFVASDFDHGPAAGLWYLTDDLEAALPPPIRNTINNRLGITLSENTFRAIVAEVMLLHARVDGTRWRPVQARGGRHQIWLRGKLYDAPVIVGAVHTESFNQSDSSTLGPDLTWAEPEGNWETVSNKAKIVSTGTPVSYARAEASTDADDAYAQCDVTYLDAPTGYAQIGVQARMATSTRDGYMWFLQRNATDEGYKLRKTSSGARSDLTSYSTDTLPAEPFTTKLTVEGSTLKGFIGVTQKDTVTDTSFSGSGYRKGGLYGYAAAAGSTSPYVEVDAFEFGDTGLTTEVTADGDGTTTLVVDEADGTTTLYTSVDDYDTPIDTDWVNNVAAPGTDAIQFFDLEAMPAAFDKATDATLHLRYRGQKWGSGTATLYARLYQSNETTALSNEVVVVAVTANGSFANVTPVTFTGVDTTSGKAVWDGARIRYRWVIT